MAIITKPVEGILKNVPAIFTLNKSQVLALSIVSNDEYFYDSNNWKIIILKYESSEGKQQELVRFDATLESPTGFFFVSEKARDLFEIKSLKIVDFDGDILVIPRSELTTADFDVEFLNPPSNLSYTTPVSYTQNIQITNNIPSVTGTVTSYSISPALPTGLTINPTTGVISGTPTVAVAAANYTVTASNSGGSTTATINITVESEVSDEFWDVANKSGVGTVSVGANRLITKTSGGGAYDVNVLSLETITGDGYIEFPNSSLLNIGNFGVSVIGLAEQTSTNGGYQNIILGAFTTNGNWERVVNGSTSGVISATNPNDIVRIGRIGTEYYIKINDVIKTQVTINNTNPLKASISLFTTGTGVDNITVESAEVPVTGDYVIWDLLNGPTTNEVGGLFTNAEAASTWTKLAKSSIGFDGDFTLTYVFDSADDNEIALGVSSNKTDLSSFSGAYAMLNRYNQGFFEYQNSPSSIGGNYPIPASGVQNLIVQRVGSQLTFTLNQTLLVTETVTGTLYPLGRPYLGNIISTYYDITVTSYLTYELNTAGATLNATGGVSGGNSGDDVYAKDSSGASGDFAYEWKFNWSSINPLNVLFGVTGTYSSGSWFGNLTCLEGVSGTNPEKARLWVNGTQSVLTNITIPDGDNVYKLTRSGTVISHYLNGSLIYGSSVPLFTAYPTVRTKGLSACIESYIPEVLPTSYYTYNQVAAVHTTDQFGAISSTGIGSSYNTTPLTGNFDITFNFDAAVTGNDSIFGVKQTLDFTDNYLGFRLFGGFHSYSYGQVRDLITQNSGANAYRITRTGSTIDFYANGVKLSQSASYSGILYLVVRGYNTFNLISTVDNLGTGSNFVPVTWNVAGKTGVGTVTTGANGLITKATGGNSYNVNVLSNETITGDGYVEFINSSIFLNVVFGLAEINSASGSYDQIIYGTYVAGLGAYERVLAGQASGGSVGASANGDVVRIQRTGTTFSILKNGSVINTVTINNTNPLKASISIFAQTYGVNNVTKSE